MPKEFKPLDPAGRALEKLLDQRPVLWVGAGTSIAAGYPSTGQLVDRIRERSFDPIPEGLVFTEVADRFVANNTAGELSDLLQQTIGPSRDPTPTLRAVGRLAAADRIAAIVTTNYDNLLERVLDDCGVHYIPQTLQDNFELIDDGQLRLLKIHGSREDWSRTRLRPFSRGDNSPGVYAGVVGLTTEFLAEARLRAFSLVGLKPRCAVIHSSLRPPIA